MNNEKSPKNEAPDARLAPAQEKGDNSLDMHLAQPSSLSDINKALAGVTALRSQGVRDSFLWRVVWVAAYPFFWVKLRVVARNLDRVAQSASAGWSSLLQRSRPQNTIYARSKATDLELLESIPKESDFVAFEGNLDTLANAFPQLVSRMRNTMQRLRTTINNLSHLIPVEDAAMVQDAERQYLQGELLDLETFIHGVQGVR